MERNTCFPLVPRPEIWNMCRAADDWIRRGDGRRWGPCKRQRAADLGGSAQIHREFPAVSAQDRKWWDWPAGLVGPLPRRVAWGNAGCCEPLNLWRETMVVADEFCGAARKR